MPSQTLRAPVRASSGGRRARRLRSLRLLLLVAAAALVPTAFTAAAEPYPLPTHENGTISRTQCQAGDTVVFSGTGYRPIMNGNARQRLSVTDNGRPMGTTPVADDGSFAFTFEIRSNTSVGQHTYVAKGTGANGAPRDTTAVCHVVGVTQSAGQQASSGDGGGNGVSGDGVSGGGVGRGGALPFTGADVMALVASAVLLIAVGALLVLRNQAAARRRGRRRHPAAV